MTDKLTKQDISEIQNLIKKVEDARRFISICNNKDLVLTASVYDRNTQYKHGEQYLLSPPLPQFRLRITEQCNGMVRTLNEKYGVQI